MPECPCCGASVEMGAPSCTDCGLALGGLDTGAVPECEPAVTDAGWPVDGDGQTVTPVLLYSAKNPTDCALKESFLRGCGIPVLVRTPLPNQFSSVLFGGPILGADLFVPETRLAEARSLLHESDSM